MTELISPRGGVDAKNDNCNLLTLDYSFKEMLLVEDILDEESRVKINKADKDSDGKVNAQTVKLNNNQLSEMTGLDTTLSKIIQRPEDLTWIDLSLNDFSKIDPLLLKYTNLKMLYLHGNNITNISEVDKLAGLPNLIALTLHGNPIDNQKGYRQSIVAKLPQLRKIDFSCVIKSDRQNANTWERTYGKRKPPKKKEES